MGLMKGIKDLAGITKQAKQMSDQQLKQAGYKPGFGGMMSQMGDMIGQAKEQLEDLTEQSGDQQRVLAEGIPGEAIIMAMGTPARGAQQFNLDLDLEVHVSGRDPYRVANQYMVPASAPLGQGARLPVKVDPNDPAKVAIDCASVGHGPAHGEVRPVAGAPAPPAPEPSAGGGDDALAQLERLAKLRDSGVLTDAEFDQQKARILGS